MRRTVLQAIALVFVPGIALAGVPPAGVAQVLKTWEGKSAWLRIDLIRVQYMLNGKDATNVLPDGHVRYRLKMGIRATESTSTEEFTKDIERSLQQSKTVGHVRVVGKGSRVTIAKAEASDDQVELEVHDSGGSKNMIRLKYDDDKAEYTPDNVQKLLAVCFAESEAEARGEKPTAAIALGMTVEQVLAAKGPAKTRVDLGAKTILTYEDLKLVFENGQLSDVQ